MKLNKKTTHLTPHTHEGAPATRTTPEAQLRRSVMACMLWEDTFYESGESIADRILSAVAKVPANTVAEIAVEAREQMNLRHVPLLIVRAMAKLDTHKYLVADTLARIIQRPDELAEFLAIYWKNGRQPLSAQVKKGLARAFTKFSEYQLAKYNRDADVTLRDVMFLSHAKPANKTQTKLFERVADNTLKTPDTWEVALSSGADKGETFSRLIAEEKLGGLALLRNLRNMIQSGVDKSLIREALSKMNTKRILPFRFIAAARYAPEFEAELETAMFQALADAPRLWGHTVIAIDTSGSMGTGLSNKSDMSRRDAAAALAMILREVCEQVTVIAFGTTAGVIRPRRGFALNDEIGSGRFGHGTNVGLAAQLAEQQNPDRIIIVTDEQSHDPLANPRGLGYLINVAAYKNGIGYGKWIHLDGFSEAIVKYITAFEQENL